MEWRRQINNVTFYTQDLGGEPLPNDDLDLQLVWLLALEKEGLDIDAHTLAEYWMLYVTPHYAEYGTGKTNLRTGLMPPLSGNVNNPYKDSCGAFIRSEIWACIAPAMPEVAARYAYEDAIVDHGNGEGTYAAIFIAVMESIAFIVSDIYKLIDIARSYIPDDCGVAKAVQTAIDCYKTNMNWKDARDEILRKHRGLTAGGNRINISEEDIKKGFFDGAKGYDAPSNIAIIILGILYGEGDFEKTLCITVNCGEDTDCTGATVGSLFGIMYGANSIPQKWIEPIGRNIKTLCVNNSELPIPLPKTIDELTERTIYIAKQSLMKYGSANFLTEKESDLSDIDRNVFCSKDEFLSELYNSLNGPRYKFNNFTVCTDYYEGPFIVNEQRKKIKITVYNNSRVPAALSLYWYLPDGEWKVYPSKNMYALCQQSFYKKPAIFDFEISCKCVLCTVNRAVVEIIAEGRIERMLIPFTFINGNKL